MNTPSSAETNSRENRSSDRVPIDIFLNKYVAGVPYVARTLDISLEGICLAHLIDPFAGSPCWVRVEFQLPDSEEVLYAEGEVVRQWSESRMQGSAIRFTYIAEQHRALIERYLQRRASPAQTH